MTHFCCPIFRLQFQCILECKKKTKKTKQFQCILECKKKKKKKKKNNNNNNNKYIKNKNKKKIKKLHVGNTVVFPSSNKDICFKA